MIEFASASEHDAEELVRIRIEAMRESLERVGRFSPERSRERFLSNFEPQHTRFILVEGKRVGFVVVKPFADHLLLDHLYVVPAFQGRGIGAEVLKCVFAEADLAGLPIRVGALRESDSNRFYISHGFVQVSESEWDIYYERAANSY